MVVCRRLTDSQIEFFKMVDAKVASVSVQVSLFFPDANNHAQRSYANSRSVSTPTGIGTKQISGSIYHPRISWSPMPNQPGYPCGQ